MRWRPQTDNDEPADPETSLLEKPDLWKQFKTKAEGNGFSTNDALVRLMRRYLARGFDDGMPEAK